MDIINQRLLNFIGLSRSAKTTTSFKAAEKFLSSDTNYYSTDNIFHYYISWTIPVGCKVSFFSNPLSVGGGTHGERPTDSVKQKTSTHR